MFKQVIRKAVNILINFIKVNLGISNVNPYAVEWATHYALGSQKKKTLPKALLPIARESVLMHLKSLQSIKSLNGRGWDNHRVSNDKCGSSVPAVEYYSHSLAGIVGSFNISCVPGEKGLVVKCSDTWNFNETGIGCVKFEVPRFIAKIAMKMGVKVFDIDAQKELFRREGLDTNELKWILYEKDLAVLNAHHEFKTEWEHVISWEELPYNKEQIDWDKLMPKWALRRDSKLNALQALGFDILSQISWSHNKEELYILPKKKELAKCQYQHEWRKCIDEYGTGDWARKIEVTWPLINKMRENPSKIKWDCIGNLKGEDCKLPEYPRPPYPYELKNEKIREYLRAKMRCMAQKQEFPKYSDFGLDEKRNLLPHLAEKAEKELQEYYKFS